MFVVSSKQHISAVGRWKDSTMMRHWRLGLSVICLAVLAVIIIPWAVKAQLAYKLDQGIQDKPTPAYELMEEDPAVEGSSEEGTCEDIHADYFGYGYECLYVNTKATDAVTLASITHEVSITHALTYGNDVSVPGVQVEFSRRGRGWQAISYCFASKNAAISKLRLRLYMAELLGRTGSCYIAVYKPYLPLLLPDG
jgi:hypothetical protein